MNRRSPLPTHGRRPSIIRSRIARGFSLVELMIVIAIIIVLIGLVLAVSTALLRKSEERVTRNVMQSLDLAVREWERQVDRPVTFQHAVAETGAWDVPYNPTLTSATKAGWPSGEGLLPPPYNTSLRAQRSLWFYDLIAQHSTAADILSKIPEDHYRRTRTTAANPVYFTLREVLDGWGNPIYAVFPGRLWGTGPSADTNPADIDGTMRCQQEIDVLGAATVAAAQCRNKQVLFVSGGADGDITTTADNIYSYGEAWQ